MTQVDVQYNDGSGWHDLTGYVTEFTVSESGIQQVPQAIINLEANYSDFSGFFVNPYQLIRLRANINSLWKNLFFGYTNTPAKKKIAGLPWTRYKLNLTCNSGAARLANEYITMNYYRLQSAISPYNGAEAWTYRRMLNDIFVNPDSKINTGFTVQADTNPNGIDHYIETSCSWSQTVFDVVRTVADRIGYDGYYYLPDESSSWKVVLSPFNKASCFIFTGHFVGEPELVYGSLDDVYNLVYVWGGVDAGIPSDGDRWTEYAATKYAANPIWSITAGNGNLSLTDTDNIVFTNQNYRTNSKCLKAQLSNSTSDKLDLILDLTKTENAGTFDAYNRLTKITLCYKGFADTACDSIAAIGLEDVNGIRIFSDISEDGAETLVTVDLATKIYPYIVGSAQAKNTWYWDDSNPTATTFDWSNLSKVIIRERLRNTPQTSTTWGFYIDGLQFVGGLNIEPFDPELGVFYPHYGATLNPVIKDQTSINNYGVHVFHLRDSNISSFEQAQTEGQRVLNNLKTLKQTLTFRQIVGVSGTPTDILKPSNVVTVEGTDYRLTQIDYRWKATDKKLYADYQAVQKTAYLPPIWTNGEYGYMKYLIK
jgi:hypothetical protein